MIKKKWSRLLRYTHTNKNDMVWEKVTFTGAVQSCHPVFRGKTRLFCGMSGWTHVLRIKLVKRTSQTWVLSRQQRVDIRGVIVRETGKTGVLPGFCRIDCNGGSYNLGFLPSQLATWEVEWLNKLTWTCLTVHSDD